MDVTGMKAELTRFKLSRSVKNEMIFFCGLKRSCVWSSVSGCPRLISHTARQISVILFVQAKHMHP